MRTRYTLYNKPSPLVNLPGFVWVSFFVLFIVGSSGSILPNRRISVVTVSDYSWVYFDLFVSLVLSFCLM